MTPGFSLRRIFNRRRYFYARVALNPQQALDLCIGYWVSTGAWGETPGMREQLAQQGWVGTELVTGSDLRHFAVSSFFDDLPVIGIFPSLAPKSIKRARQERKHIIVAARACSVGGRPASELWCFDGDVTSMDPAVSNAFMDEALDDMTNALLAQGVLLGPPKRFMGHDLPKDHLFTRENILSMRKAAKKESRRRR
ncbi:MAG: hypothetical protein DI576_13195 [Actinomyces sp.]|nr:MAG: hypothetical protein DI576_13195 [Actinomyces sp.]